MDIMLDGFTSDVGADTTEALRKASDDVAGNEWKLSTTERLLLSKAQLTTTSCSIAVHRQYGSAMLLTLVAIIVRLLTCQWIVMIIATDFILTRTISGNGRTTGLPEGYAGLSNAISSTTGPSTSRTSDSSLPFH